MASPQSGLAQAHARFSFCRAHCLRSRIPSRIPVKRPKLPVVKRRHRWRPALCALTSKTFVAGATGRVGQEIVRMLLQKGVQTTVLVRNPSAAAARLPAANPLLKVVEGDVYRPETLPAAIQGSQAMVVATGIDPVKDPWGPFTVDFQEDQHAAVHLDTSIPVLGVRNLVRCGQEAGIEKIVLVSSRGVDCFPFNFIIGALFFKKRGEEAVQRSGIDYTIVRPGKLLDRPPRGRGQAGQIVVSDASPFSLPPAASPAAILQSQVAEVCMAALDQPAASNKIVEVVADWTQGNASSGSLFEFASTSS